MAIKGGQILHVTGGFVIDRIQTGGITGINVNEDRIEELGNVEAIGTLRDIPDLTFEIESFDVSTELESILLGGINDESDGATFDLADNVPINILSPFKTSGAYTVDGGVIVPFLTLESLSYSFALGDPATMTASMRGDSVFYTSGSVFEETFDGTGSQTVFSFANTAYKSTISGTDYYALSLTVDDVRQRIVTDYSNSATDFTFVVAPASGTGNVKVVYASAAAVSYLQTVHPAGVAAQGTLTLDTIPTDADTMTIDSKVYTWEDTLTDVDGNIYTGGTLAQAKLNLVAAMDLSGSAGTDYATSMTAHGTVDIATFISDDAILTAKAVGLAGDSIATTETYTPAGNIFDATTLGAVTSGVDAKPVGVRGRDTYVRLGNGDTIPTYTDWLGVQSGSIDWSVSLERDEEFGNSQVVSQDFDTPDVSGSITMKAADVNALMSQIQDVAGISGTDVANATEDPPELQIEIKTKNNNGVTTKTWIVPDAKFVLPQLSGAVGSKLESDFTFISTTGVLEIYKADPA